MVLNCLKCGKSISSKLSLCPYCHADIAMFSNELEEAREKSKNKKIELQERYKGTLASFLMK